MKKKFVVGLDVGGTHIRGGLFSKEMSDFIEEGTDKRGGRIVLGQIISIINSLISGVDRRYLAGIGIGVPGPVDREKGVLYQAPNIHGMRNIHLKRILERKFKVKVEVENDVNCAALAESQARKSSDMIYINLGTGVGGGIILGGKIFRGKRRNIEIGHIAVGEGEKCNAGHVGCFEAFVSGSGILKYAGRFYENVDMPRLMNEAARRKRKALEIFQRSGKYLGIGIASLANTFDPPLVVLGGGVAEAYSYMKQGCLQELRKRCFSLPKIEIARVKNAGVIGARMLVD